MDTDTRPSPGSHFGGAELRRWYWLRDELAALARDLGLPSGGSKDELTARIAAHLDGDPAPPTTRRPGPAPAMPEPLGSDTVMPDGQRCSEQLRAWLVAQVGPGFRFDRPMRELVADGAGRTLGELVEHWHATRDRPADEIGEQFELNRFTRQWHLDHPGGDRATLLADWRRHRSLPVDRRGRA